MYTLFDHIFAWFVSISVDEIDSVRRLKDADGNEEPDTHYEARMQASEQLRFIRIQWQDPEIRAMVYGLLLLVIAVVVAVGMLA